MIWASILPCLFLSLLYFKPNLACVLWNKISLNKMFFKSRLQSTPGQRKPPLHSLFCARSPVSKTSSMAFANKRAKIEQKDSLPALFPWWRVWVFSTKKWYSPINVVSINHVEKRAYAFQLGIGRSHTLTLVLLLLFFSLYISCNSSCCRLCIYY